MKWKHGLIVGALLTLSALAVAASFALGVGVIEIGDDVGLFQLSASVNGPIAKGTCNFVQLSETAETALDTAISLPRATSVEIAGNMVTMSGPGAIWQNGVRTPVEVTVTATDDPAGDTFSITAGTYSAGGTLVKGNVVVGSN